MTGVQTCALPICDGVEEASALPPGASAAAIFDSKLTTKIDELAKKTKLKPIIIKAMAITVSAPTLVSLDTFIILQLNKLYVKLAKKGELISICLFLVF